MQNKFQLVLASSSPRRRELLGYTYLNYEVIPSTVEEKSDATDPKEVVVDLAKLKARDVLENHCQHLNNPLVLGSDTIVVFESDILGKPKNRAEAKMMLSRLSGNTHEVYTGVYFCHQFGSFGFYEKTLVEFEKIDTALLEHYLNTGDSLDKAGAYGIQSHSLGFIKSVNGSYSNVVGLPVNLVYNKLKEFLKSEDIYELFD